MQCSSCNAKIVKGSFFCDHCGATQTQGAVVARKIRQTSLDNVKESRGGLLTVGEKIKNYVVEEAIAKSGFGATFRALRLKDNKQVLIKQMIDQQSYDIYRDELFKSFKREAKFLRKTKHPAFPRGYEYFEKNKSIYLIMDFINGKELAKAISDYKEKNGKIEDGLIVYVGMEIAEALEIIHISGHLYRDLKPQNVMLDGISSRVKLIDFGTLYHPSDKNPLLFESEGYTPAEFLDKTKKWTAAGDIYSLGALLFEMATGELSKTPDLNLLRKSNRDKRLIQIIEKCLDQDPAKRYQRARHLRDELYKITRKGIWPFSTGNAIKPIELSVLPKTLFPSQCTFCEFCGFADTHSQVGYCPKCRVPLKVGQLTWKEEKKDKEFLLFSDETTIGKAADCHFSLKNNKMAEKVNLKHVRIFRSGNSLWLEVLDKHSHNTKINNRKVLGPIELVEGDNLELDKFQLKFSLKDAC
jgi:serine/threonine protein kinase